MKVNNQSKGTGGSSNGNNSRGEGEVGVGVGIGDRGKKDKYPTRRRGSLTSGGTCLCMGTGVNKGAFFNQSALYDDGMVLEGMKSMVTSEIVLEDEHGKYAGVVNATFSISLSHSDE